MMDRRCLFTLALAAALLPATAADPPATPDQRMICRGGDRQLSSRIRSPRRCRTAEQWAREADEKARLPVGMQTTQGQNDGRAPTQPR
jgi:hypothetical protein